MMCYKGKTFCVAACSNESCSRKLTDEVRAGAVAWMGEDAPIAVTDFSGNCENFIGVEDDVTF